MDIKTIHLSWRQGKGEERYLVGELRKAGNEVSFRYNKVNIDLAAKQGFKNYPDFPNTDPSVIYTGDLQSIFSLRLMPLTRPDRITYFTFWEIKEQPIDWFEELAFTQGRLATDNFEFLAEFPYYENGLRFVTDIASLSHRKLDVSSVSINDKVTFELEPGNRRDPNAVKVLKDGVMLGYIKKGHNLFFKEANPNRVSLKIKHIEKNGFINQIYVLVEKHSG